MLLLTITWYMNWWGYLDPYYYHVPWGTTTFQIHAVFEQLKALVVRGEGVWFVSNAKDKLKDDGCYHVDYIQTNNKYGFLSDLTKNYDIFCYDGHAGNDYLLLIDPENCPIQNECCIGAYQGYPYCVNEESDIANTIWNNGNAQAHYKFVYILACHTGEEASLWRQAFNAECFLGFNGEIQDFVANVFDSLFWYYLFDYNVTIQAAAESSVGSMLVLDGNGYIYL